MKRWPDVSSMREGTFMTTIIWNPNDPCRTDTTSVGVFANIVMSDRSIQNLVMTAAVAHSNPPFRCPSLVARVDQPCHTELEGLIMLVHQGLDEFILLCLIGQSHLKFLVHKLSKHYGSSVTTTTLFHNSETRFIDIMQLALGQNHRI